MNRVRYGPGQSTLVLNALLVLLATVMISSGIPRTLDWLFKLSLTNYITLAGLQFVVLRLSYQPPIRNLFGRLPLVVENASRLLPLFFLTAALAQKSYRFAPRWEEWLFMGQFAMIGVAACLAALLVSFLFDVSLQGDAHSTRRTRRASVLSFLILVVTVTFLAYRSMWPGVGRSPAEVTREQENRDEEFGSPVGLASNATQDRSDVSTVALIVLDTVRADAILLSSGPGAAHLPTLRPLIEEGLSFSHVHAASSWTTPSHAVLFTGNSYYEGSERFLAPQNETVAEQFQEAGYVTIGLSANQNLRRDNGFGQGFDIFVNRPADLFTAYNPLGVLWGSVSKSLFAQRSANASQMTDLALAILDRLGGRRVYLFVNYMDAHDPYLPTSSSIASYSGITAVDLPLGVLRRSGHSLNSFMQNRSEKLSDTEVAKMRLLYLACLTDIDREFEALYKKVRTREELGPSLVAITSDHGELFDEYNGFFGHKNQLWRKELEVPLLLLGSLVEPAARGQVDGQYIDHSQVGRMLTSVAKSNRPLSLLSALTPHHPTGESPGAGCCIAAMGPTETLRGLSDQRGRYAESRLATVFFPGTGREALFADNELVGWRSGPDVATAALPRGMSESDLGDEVDADLRGGGREWETAIDAAAYHFRHSAILASEVRPISVESWEALRELGYLE